MSKVIALRAADRPLSKATQAWLEGADIAATAWRQTAAEGSPENAVLAAMKGLLTRADVGTGTGYMAVQGCIEQLLVLACDQ